MLYIFLLASGICPAQNNGYLSVSSQPEYSLIYLDGEYTGSRTPTAILLEARPGKHRLELLNQGYKLYQGEVNIEAGRILEVSIALAKIDSKEASKVAISRYIEAYINISSKPPGADVYLDDKLLGKTPIANREIPPGEPKDKKLKIVKTGYEPYEEIIGWPNIRDSIKIYVSRELKPAAQPTKVTSGDIPKSESKTASPVKSQKAKRFIFNLNVQMIVLFILLVLLVAIFIVRIVVKSR